MGALARDGWRILGVSRRPELAGHLQPMGDVGQIHAVQANIRYADSVRRPVAGAELVVNLVGIRANAGPQTFDRVHVVGARAVAKAAREVGAKRLVHISAIAAHHPRVGEYARTKAEGEAVVLDQFPSAVILRPSLVFGPEDQLFNRFAAMARLSPILPLIGGGRTRLQPIYVGDVARAIAAASADTAKPGTDRSSLAARTSCRFASCSNSRCRGPVGAAGTCQCLLACQAHGSNHRAAAAYDATSDARGSTLAGTAEYSEYDCHSRTTYLVWPGHRAPQHHVNHSASLSPAFPPAGTVRQLWSI